MEVPGAHFAELAISIFCGFATQPEMGHENEQLVCRQTWLVSSVVVVESKSLNINFNGW